MPAGGSSAADSGAPTVNTSAAKTLTPTQQAINAANSLGTPLKDITDLQRETSPVASAQTQQSSSKRVMLTPGTCANGILFNAPDLAGTPDTTETQYFYNTNCTELARDIVRKFDNPNGTGTETVYRTMKQYYEGKSALVAIRTDTVTLTQGTYDQNGFPIASVGFVRTATGALGLPPLVEYLDSDNEQILEPADNKKPDAGVGGGGSTNTFCMDSAGYNTNGVSSTGNTFGWNGGVPNNGTRTSNADGTVTWQGTHIGNPMVGPIGALTFSYGTPSTTCPTATPPLFTLQGGTSSGTYTIPVTATYNFGLLVGLTVSGATLASGDGLNVSSSGSPTSPNFIQGTVTQPGGKGTIATFALNAFGDGTLSTTAGRTFTILDWHVARSAT
jgi:hypothetical protein